MAFPRPSADRMPFKRHAFFNLGQRDDVATSGRLDQKTVDQGEGEWQAEDEGCSLAGGALDRHAPAERPHGVAHDVEADSAARQFAHRVASREARLEDQADHPRIIGRRSRWEPFPA